ncbi:MAG: hypothetical protein HGA45_21805 [Chloroflexales bacterium]|nr:hypothetical protein [Chloroflexales bacterium]
MTRIQKAIAMTLLTAVLVGALLAFTEGWMRFTSAFIYAAFARAILTVPER